MQQQYEENVGRREANFEDLLRECVNNAGLNKRKSVDVRSNCEIHDVTPSSNDQTELTVGHNVPFDAEKSEKDSDDVKENIHHPNEPDEKSERVSQSNPHHISVIGAILRIMGDEQYCRACGKHLRFMGDEIYFMYAARRMMSPLLLELATSDSMYY